VVGIKQEQLFHFRPLLRGCAKLGAPPLLLGELIPGNLGGAKSDRRFSASACKPRACVWSNPHSPTLRSGRGVEARAFAIKWSTSVPYKGSQVSLKGLDYPSLAFWPRHGLKAEGKRND